MPKLGGTANFLRYVRSQSNGIPIQRVHATCGRCAYTKTPKHHHISPVLKSLYWLKVPERIEYKVISLTYNTLQSSQPSDLRQLFTIHPLIFSFNAFFFRPNTVL